MTPQDQIALFMETGMLDNGGMSMMQGGSMAMPQIGALTPDIDMGTGMDDGYESEQESQYSEREIRIAKRYMTLVGGPERARELLDKVEEVEETLEGFIDSDEYDDSEGDEDATAISKISMVTPFDPSQPLQALANQLNPATQQNAL